MVVEAADLGRCALAIRGNATHMGISCWEGFRARSGPIADSLSHAKHKLLQDAGSRLQPYDWVGLLVEPQG